MGNLSLSSLPGGSEEQQDFYHYYHGMVYRQQVAEHWRERATVQGETVASWSTWPDGHLFLGQRGPLTERGIREIIAKLG